MNPTDVSGVGVLTNTADMTDLSFMSEQRELVDAYLDKRLPSIEKHPQALHEAIRYSVLARAKRIRPIFALTTYQALGGSDLQFALAPACALELVHTYSLIHDDLPCMDNDDLRRGLPTLHKKYNEGVAVLAGDALHDLAFGWTADAGSTQLVSELAQAIGSYGMIGGQIADMEAENAPVNAAEIEFIHRRKTGALICCSIRFGAVLAKADTMALDALTVFGQKLGLAFQIVDDILDVTGDQEKMGKSVGSDQKNLKATYPAAIGLDASQREADRLIDESIEALSRVAFPTERLVALAKFVGQRES